MPTSDEDVSGRWIAQEPWKRSNQVIGLNARDLSGEDWYTNPHGNESPGHCYQTLRQAKHDNGTGYHPPTIVVYLREPRGEERTREDKWTEMDIGRRIAGCLTDLEVMAGMGLIRVRVVLEAEGETELDSDEKKAAGPFKGVKADVRRILGLVLK